MAVVVMTVMVVVVMMFVRMCHNVSYFKSFFCCKGTIKVMQLGCKPKILPKDVS